MNRTTNYATEITGLYHNDISFLKNVVEQHPGSSFARFLYLYELKRSQMEEFEEEAKKTASYFTNPLWLQYQLQLPVLTEDSIADGEWNEEDAEEEQVIEEEEITVLDRRPQWNEEEFLAADSDEETAAEEGHEEPYLENADTEQTAINEREKEQQVEFVSGAALPENEPSVEDAFAEEDHQPKKEKERNAIAEPFEFEPLHMVDYFASQGITIREEALANDKLSKQVKSFTAWLKTMKTLHPGKIPEQNEVVENIIQTSADESNAQSDILTEAMAEVLLKQNKKEKAIEMYEKLSLMNPVKSTYFAAKIESIKQSRI